MNHTISSIIDVINAPTPPRWFEFLLGPKQQPEGIVGRLQQHLETPGCDPSPTQLISLFFRNIPTLEGNTICNPISNTISNSNSANDEIKNGVANDITEKLLVDYAATADTNDIQIPPDSYEAEYRAKKAYALQILAIKVASFLKWDLNLISNSLTIPVQHKLMQAFANACSSKNCPAEVKKFAAILYCHWFVRSAITYRLSALQPQANNTTIIYLSQLQQQQQAAESSALCSMGELFAHGSKHLKTCSSELHSYIWEFTHNNNMDNCAKKMKTSTHPFEKVKLKQPKIDCFNSWDEQDNDWDKCEWIEPKEFMESACYDLGRFFFFEESYDLAKQCFEIIKDPDGKFSKLTEYYESASALLKDSEGQNGKTGETDLDLQDCDFGHKIKEKRQQTEKYLFECMTQFSQNQKKETEMDVDENEQDDEDDFEDDLDLKFEQNQQSRPDNAWYLQVPPNIQQQQLLEAAKGDVFMSQGNFKQAMGCFVGTLMLMTDYFRIFSKNYIEEEPYISRMIQCSISLSCFTQAVALCQMARSLNYTIAFKQLNERVCNDCCDDIYECIWDVTLLEYIINLHSKRGEVERRTRVIQLIGQLELNENNPEEILKEAEHVRRGRFFRIMSNKYL